MKVILKQDHELLGDEGQLVEVKNGYARNYLIPRGIATIASVGNLKNFEEIKRQKSRKIKKQIEDANKIASELSDRVINIEMKAGEDNKIFGSVTSQMIYDNLVKNGFETLDRKKIILKEPIKTLGEHEIEIKLQNSVIAKIKVNVVKETSNLNSDQSDDVKEEIIEQKES